MFNTCTTLLTCTSVAVKLTLSRSLQVYGLQFSLHHASTCPLNVAYQQLCLNQLSFLLFLFGYIFQDVWHIFLNDSRHHSKYRLYNKFFLQDLQQEYDTYCFLTYPDQMLSGYLISLLFPSSNSCTRLRGSDNTFSQLLSVIAFPNHTTCID